VEFNKSWIRNPMQTAHEQRASLATMQRVLCRRGVPGAYLAPNRDGNKTNQDFKNHGGGTGVASFDLRRARRSGQAASAASAAHSSCCGSPRRGGKARFWLAFGIDT